MPRRFDDDWRPLTTIPVTRGRAFVVDNLPGVVEAHAAPLFLRESSPHTRRQQRLTEARWCLPDGDLSSSFFIRTVASAEGTSSRR